MQQQMQHFSFVYVVYGWVGGGKGSYMEIPLKWQHKLTYHFPLAYVFEGGGNQKSAALISTTRI